MSEFVRYKKRQYRQMEGHDMPEDEEELLRAQFQRMDTDRSGEVDWWEFVRFEARRYLARKHEVEYEWISNGEINSVISIDGV